MSCDLTTGVSGCKDGIGGIKTLYLTSFVDYLPTQIETDGVYLTEIPLTYVYKYDVYDMDFSERTTDDKGVYYEQTLNFSVPRTSYDREVHKMAFGRTRAFYIDRNGVIRSLGLYNGLTGSYSNETGNGKTDMNGYRVTLSGKEEKQAYFIDDLTTIGVITEEAANYVFQDGNNFIYNDGVNNYIFNG